MKKKILKEIIGTWKGISCTYKDEKGKRINYFGKKYKGILVYDSEGNMTAQLTRGDTPLFTSNDSSFSGTRDECKVAFDSYQAYFGKYEFDFNEKTITHIIKGALKPNWVGQRQVRYPKLKDGILTLKTAPIEIGKSKIVFTLKWIKVT